MVDEYRAPGVVDELLRAARGWTGAGYGTRRLPVALRAGGACFGTGTQVATTLAAIWCRLLQYCTLYCPVHAVSQ